MSNPLTNADQVNAVIKVRRGPENDRSQTIPDSGELLYSTDKKRLFIGDQLTYGGNIVGNKVWYSDSFDKLPEIEKYDLVYRTDLKGLYILIGDNILSPSSYILLGGLELIQKNTIGGVVTYTLPKAEEYVLGGVMVREGLTVNDGRLSVNYDSTLQLVGNKLSVVPAASQTIPYASYTQNGGVQIAPDSGINIIDGKISISLDDSTIKLASINGVTKIYVDSSNLTFPDLVIANESNLGGIIIGNGLSADNTGVTELKKADNVQLGGVIVGDGLNVDNTGTISLNMNSVSGTASLSSNGYQILPSGLIMQWGTLSSVALDETYQKVVFPISFINSVFNVQATLKYSPVVGGSIGIAVKDMELSGCYICGDHSTNTTTGDIMWQAIGY